MERPLHRQSTCNFIIDNRFLFFFAEGYSGVVEPSECIHISDKAKTISKVKSLLPVNILY